MIALQRLVCLACRIGQDGGRATACRERKGKMGDGKVERPPGVRFPIEPGITRLSRFCLLHVGCGVKPAGYETLPFCAARRTPRSLERNSVLRINRR